MGATDARQVTQALANCGQGISHRGNVSLAGNQFSQSNGVVNNSPWTRVTNNNYYGEDLQFNEADDLFRPGGGLTYVNVNNPPFEIPPPGDYRGGDWYTYMGDNNYFDVAPRITENYNQFFGGPTFQVAGDSHFNNSYTNNAYSTNHYVTNLTVNQINGEPVVGERGEKGDPGLAGPQGPPGLKGDPGNGLVLQQFLNQFFDQRVNQQFNINQQFNNQINNLNQQIFNINRVLGNIRAVINEDCTVSVTVDYAGSA